MESTLVLVLLGIVILISSWNVWHFGNKMPETARNKTLVAEKAEALRQQKINLETDIQKLETDRGKEEFFRENYGLAKEGEEVIVIVEAKTPAETPRPGALSGFFSFFKNLFK